MSKRYNLLKKLARNYFGADFTTLRTSTPSLCFSVSKSCCRIWSQSHHCKKVDTSLNECLRLISCCVKFTPTELLSILFGIEPMDIRRNKNIPSLCIRVMENTHIFHQTAIFHLQVVDSKVEHHYQLVCTV